MFLDLPTGYPGRMYNFRVFQSLNLFEEAENQITATRNTADVTTLYQFFDANFCWTCVSHPSPWFYLIIESQIDFIIYIDIAWHYRSPQTIAVFNWPNPEIVWE